MDKVPIGVNPQKNGFKFIMWNLAKFFVVGLAVVAAAIYGCDLLLKQSLTVRRDVNRYETYLAESPSQRLVSHFPKRVDDPKNATVAFFPGALQGGAFLQLRLKMKRVHVDAIEKIASSMSIANYNGGRKYTYFNRDQANNYPTTSFHTIENAPEGLKSFPDHFTLYVLVAEQNGIDWNTTGIAVSSRWSEVVYWAEYNP